MTIPYDVIILLVSFSKHLQMEESNRQNSQQEKVKSNKQKSLQVNQVNNKQREERQLQRGLNSKQNSHLPKEVMSLLQ